MRLDELRCTTKTAEDWARKCSEAGKDRNVLEEFKNSIFSALAEKSLHPQQRRYYEDLDNAADTGVFSLGINWYRSGHNAKWQAGWQDFDKDGDDGSVFQIGVVLGNSN